MRKLLLDGDVAVLIVYVGPPVSIVGAQRDDLWREIDLWLRQPSDNPNDRTDFGGYEYRTLDRKRKLLIVYKSC